MKKSATSFLFVLICIVSGVQAQTTSEKHTVISAAGDHYNANDIQLNWTLGEVSIEAVKGHGNLITQGFHQGEYIMKNVLEGQELDISIYPNPSFDFISIDIRNLTGEMFLQLFDVNGQVIVSETISNANSHHKVDMRSLKANTYFLQLNSKDDSYQSNLKVIKMN